MVRTALVSQVDPLPSWNDGHARSAILHFIERVTNDACGDYVPPADRIAVFDNDGTLWCEQPMQVQGFFLFDRIKQLAAQDPQLALQQPFKAFLEHDQAGIESLGKRGLTEVLIATHAGMSEEEFERIAHPWLDRARHPNLGRRFVDCTYQPQLELLELLRAHEFRNFIVTGGGMDLVRSFAESAYGIARERVIGSSVKMHFEMRPGRSMLWKSNALNSFDDREAKAENIGLHIGRRPLIAFGNSDGDLPMMLYTRNGTGPRLALLLHHDDAEREFAYDRDFRLSPLNDALDRAAELGVTVVSMKNDWKAVFQ
jgi:phosphoserine phosphatase